MHLKVQICHMTRKVASTWRYLSQYWNARTVGHEFSTFLAGSVFSLAIDAKTESMLLSALFERKHQSYYFVTHLGTAHMLQQAASTALPLLGFSAETL